MVLCKFSAHTPRYDPNMHKFIVEVLDRHLDAALFNQAGSRSIIEHSGEPRRLGKEHGVYGKESTASIDNDAHSPMLSFLVF